MRFIYGIIAGGLWIWFVAYLGSLGFNLSSEWAYMTIAIIAAGAMAGGD